MMILNTVNLTKTYKNGDKTINALNEANLSIARGEFVAIVGPSGSGKSTLLHLAGGIDKPSCGKVIIEGKDINELSEKELSVFRRRNIGFIFQSYNLVPMLTAEENIKLPLLLDNKTGEDAYVEEIIKTLKLEDRRKHMPSELSGGQQQRVAIARALVTKPALILADEPTGNLDKKTGCEVMDLLYLTMKKYNQTLVLITHDSEVAAHADRVIRIEDGEIIDIRGDK